MDMGAKISSSDGRLFARHVLACNIRTLRAERGWSQETLALEAGLHRTFVAHVERGARNVSLDNIERIALAFGVSVSRLFEVLYASDDASNLPPT